MAVDPHCSLDKFIRAFEEMVPGDNPSVVDQEVDVANFSSDLLSGAVNALAFTNITHKGVHLGLERYLLDSTNYF